MKIWIALALALGTACSNGNGQGCLGLRGWTLSSRAWAAYDVIRTQDTSCGPALVEALRQATSLSSAGQDTEEFAYVQILFDALIQTGGRAPGDLLEQFQRERHAEVILLAARNPDGEEELLRWMDGEGSRRLTGAEWVAVSNLLFEARSQRFFAKTLAQVAMTHRFGVLDRPGTWGSFVCGGVRRTKLQRSGPAGFPEYGVYGLDLWKSPAAVSDDGAKTFPGPYAVYCRRAVIRAGLLPERQEWISEGMTPDLDTYRAGYLAHGFTEMSEGEVSGVFFQTGTVVWSSAEQHRMQVDLELERQAQRIRDLIHLMRQRGLKVDGNLTVRIRPSFLDWRRDRREPLPEIAPKEVTWQ